MSCPNSTNAGCACPEHALGLAAYATDQVAYEAMLKPLRQPVTLRVVTPGPLDEEPCSGAMTCGCKRCVRERARRTAAPDVRQPWQPRPSRRAA